jgi:exopolysaccharide biosynthesis polyprenyl glycosylphosphotransferase
VDRNRLSDKLKRPMDLLLAMLLLVPLSPLMLLIALLIKLDSRGPALYLQERVGKHGRPFRMYKYRSMRVGADEGVHRAYATLLIRENLRPEELGQHGQRSLKMQNDPRITRVGAFLRRTSLDELPQLLNVVRGEMALVGPRPPMPYEVAVYQDWHRRRLEVTPGITGLWQVSGRNRVSFEQMVRMDLHYIEHQSLLLDLHILFQTPLAMLTGSGAG